ncbi:plasmid maintenance protein CcdB [Pseudomaricurvus alkylphenolicus]|jgi:toxin CcdB|uniref:CcdB family protein n=1 Tax=Pseudomaricurvus alkylphenolicus TaxID=1306991 RepID=UPI00141F10FF|nr:CcdB family protein [Pseudomaricurvus alkylphenolicus]NIB40574.1 plasmid maintenance protein CcdB [Pseudomaricurvus alkylphenolicus]
MAQFDVYRNPSLKSRAAYPLLMDIQSPYLVDLETRIVVPLTRKSNFSDKNLGVLTPVIEHGNEDYLLLMPQISSMPSHLLADAIGSLEHCRELVLNALDFAVGGI